MASLRISTESRSCRDILARYEAARLPLPEVLLHRVIVVPG